MTYDGRMDYELSTSELAIALRPADAALGLKVRTIRQYLDVATILRGEA